MQKENKLLKKFQNLFTALLVFAIVAIITYLFSKTGKEFNKKDFLNDTGISIKKFFVVFAAILKLFQILDSSTFKRSHPRLNVLGFK